MALNVQSFRAQLKGDGARPSLFRIRCIAPNYLNFPIEKFTFMANAASLPSSQVGERIVPYMGQDIKIAGDRVYPDYEIQILNDEGFEIRSAFEAWSNSISQYTRNDAVRVDGATSDPLSYVGTIFVDQLGKNGSIIKTYKLYNAWPAFVSAVQLAWAAKDDIETFSVSIRYDWLESVGTTS